MQQAQKHVLSEAAFRRLASRPFFIGVIGISRHFGGHEEGGWWYDWTQVHEVEEVNGWKAGLEVARRFREEYPTQKRDRFSVLGNGEDVEIVLSYCEAAISSRQSDERPHYE
jgi:hypothetical protein